jgi:hypothetical protein
MTLIAQSIKHTLRLNVDLHYQTVNVLLDTSNNASDCYPAYLFPLLLSTVCLDNYDAKKTTKVPTIVPTTAPPSTSIGR